MHDICFIIGFTLSVCISMSQLTVQQSYLLCVGSCYQTETAIQWVCGTGSWWVALTLRYSQLVHSTLSNMILSKQKNLHLFSSQNICVILQDVCSSVCPSVDRIMSALYLQQYSSDPFHICTSYQATSEGLLCVKFVPKLKKMKFWQIL